MFSLSQFVAVTNFHSAPTLESHTPTMMVPTSSYGLLSGYFLTKIAFPDIDILHPAVLSIPPKTMCLYNYYIAYVREGTILKVGIISGKQQG